MQKLKNIRDFSLKAKVFLVVLVAGALLAALWGQVQHNAGWLVKENAEIQQIELQNLIAISSLEVACKDLLLLCQKHIYSTTDNRKRYIEKKIITTQKQIQEKNLQLRKTLKNKIEKEILSKFSENYQEFLVLKRRVIQHSIEQNKNAANELLLTEGNEKFEELQEKLYMLKYNLRDRIDKRNGQLVRQRNNFKTSTLYYLIAAVLALFLLLLLVHHRLGQPLRKVKKALSRVAVGGLPPEKLPESRDEVGQMAILTNMLSDQHQNIIQFAREVGKGNFEKKLFVADDQDDIGNSLLKMRKSIKNIIKELEIQKHGEQERNWATKGFAMFSDFLREDNNDIDKLSENILRNLINYLDAAQGGFFLAKENPGNQPLLELKVAYAYHKRKLLQRTFAFGEGLVGRCANEKQSIYINEIPPEHLTITSGLGESKPAAILIVPLKLNNSVLGVLEIASFKEILPYQIQFVERLSESIASTISNVQANIKTNSLLEQAQKHARQLELQEEQMRKNLIELEETQREAERKEKEALSFEQAVNHTAIRADYSPKGELLYANTKFYDVLGFSPREIREKLVFNFVLEENRKQFRKVWKRLAQGGKHYENHENYIAKYGTVCLFATYTPVRNAEGKVERILFLALNVRNPQRENGNPTPKTI